MALEKFHRMPLSIFHTEQKFDQPSKPLCLFFETSTCFSFFSRGPECSSSIGQHNQGGDVLAKLFDAAHQPHGCMVTIARLVRTNFRAVKCCKIVKCIVLQK